MTPARAAHLRTQRIHGDAPTNQERREEVRQQTAETWTFDRLWEEYKKRRPDLKGMVTDENRYQKHIKPRFSGRRNLRPSPPLTWTGCA
jgi:hypothetical protein